MRLLNALIETQSGDIGAARAEAEALGILADDRADADPGQSWQERISGRLIGAGVRMGASDFAAAERLLERAEAELRRVPARRFATALEIARARLAALQGEAGEEIGREQV